MLQTLNVVLQKKRSVNDGPAHSASTAPLLSKLLKSKNSAGLIELAKVSQESGDTGDDAIAAGVPVEPLKAAEAELEFDGPIRWSNDAYHNMVRSHTTYTPLPLELRTKSKEFLTENIEL